MFDVLDSLKPHAHWLLRTGLASVFLYHGASKVIDLELYSQRLGMGILVAALVTFAEVVGGIGIIVGAFTNDLITRLAGLAIAPTMLGAIVIVHWGRWDYRAAEAFPQGGMEFQVVLLFMALYFLVMGNSGSSRTS